MKQSVIAFAFGLIVCFASARDADSQLPSGGVSLLKGDPLASFKITNQQHAAPIQMVSVLGQPFTQALRFQTLSKTPEPYTVQARAESAIPIHIGDIIYCQFALRCIESQTETGEGRTELAIEQGSPDYRKLVLFAGSAGKEWRTFSIPMVATKENLGGDQVAAEKLSILFRLGYGMQTIEIGGIQMLNFGNKVKIQDLPQALGDYIGREESAAWRSAAEERIEQIRKADLRIMVKDAQGNPVPSANVAVTMQKHAFGFGSAVAANVLLSQTADGQKYRETILKYFNKTVIENHLKWELWEQDRQPAMKAVQWLRENNIEVRGHNLVWPSWKLMPKDVAALKNDPEALRKRVHDHILEECTAMKGQLVDWDVINEPYANHDVMDILGSQCMAEWFRLAHKADPSAKLYINDYGTAENGEEFPEHTEAYLRMIKSLIAQGAPLQGIGIQSHFGWNLPAPAAVLKAFDRFVALGLELQVTEHDIDMTDEQCQADFTRDYLTLAFSHPAVTGFLTWGFWEGAHWVPNGAYFRKDWSLKPAGKVWIDLVTKKWWTRANGKTDARGSYQTRGFLGDYEITVRKDGQEKTVQVQLKKDAQPVTVTLE